MYHICIHSVRVSVGKDSVRQGDRRTDRDEQKTSHRIKSGATRRITSDLRTSERIEVRISSCGASSF